MLAKRRAATAACGELADAFARFGSVASAPLAVDRQAVAASCARVVEWALFLLEMGAGKLEQAEALARKALRAYGAGHPRLPGLLHDVARLWLALERPRRAAPMLKKLLPGRAEGRERALTLALPARAAAGSGARPQYDEAWNAARMIVDYDLSGTHASALLELARAAASLQDWPRMQQASRLYGLQPRPGGKDRDRSEMAELIGYVRQGEPESAS